MPEMEGGGDFLMIADPTTFRVLPWAPQTGWVLCDIYFADGKPVPFSTRHLYRARAAQARRGRLRLHGRARSRVSRVQARRSRGSSRRTPTWPGEAPEVSLLSQGYQYLTETRLRSDRADPRDGAPRCGRARPAAALGRDRARAEPMRVHLPSADRACAGRHHDAVPQRREADLPAAGLSRELHVPAEGGERDVERLAPAPVAARAAHRRQCLHVRRARNCCRRTGGTSSPACSRMRARRRPSPRRRSTATSATAAYCAGARPRDLGPRQSRRDDPRARRPRRSGDAARKPGRRAGGQSVSLHGLADRRPASTACSASSIPARRRIRPTRRRRRCCRRPSRRRSRALRADAVPRRRASARISSTIICASRRPRSRATTPEVTEWEQREYFELF